MSPTKAGTKPSETLTITGTAAGPGFTSFQLSYQPANSQDGWIPIGGDTHKTIIISIVRLDVTGGIDVRIEGRSSVPGGGWSKFVLHELNKTKPVARQHITLPTGKFDQLRVGLRIGCSDDASDTGDAAENITVTYNTFTLR